MKPATLGFEVRPVGDLMSDLDSIASLLGDDERSMLVAHDPNSSPEALIAHSISESHVVQCVVYQGMVLAVYGLRAEVARIDGVRSAEAWCVSTPLLRKHFGRQFSIFVRRGLDELFASGAYHEIHANESMENELHLRWLRFCGFEPIALKSGDAGQLLATFSRFT